MKRESHIPRPDWAQKMEALGFGFHSIDGVYWDERFCYRFDTAQIDLLDDATADMHRMCVSAAERVIADKRYAQFAIPEHAIALIEDSWNADSPSLFGRFDLSWDGSMRLFRFGAHTVHRQLTDRPSNQPTKQSTIQATNQQTNINKPSRQTQNTP